MTYREHMAEQRKAYVVDVLARTNGNKLAAAKLAGVERSNFYRLMDAAGLRGPRRTYGNTAWRALR